jgi:hypothetical protein
MLKENSAPSYEDQQLVAGIKSHLDRDRHAKFFVTTEYALMLLKSSASIHCDVSGVEIVGHYADGFWTFSAKLPA